MNKVYKVVWNQVTGCYCAVSELAKTHKKSTAKTVGVFIATALLSTSAALAVPETEIRNSEETIYVNTCLSFNTFVTTINTLIKGDFGSEFKVGYDLSVLSRNKQSDYVPGIMLNTNKTVQDLFVADEDEERYSNSKIEVAGNVILEADKKQEYSGSHPVTGDTYNGKIGLVFSAEQLKLGNDLTAKNAEIYIRNQSSVIEKFYKEQLGGHDGYKSMSSAELNNELQKIPAYKDEYYSKLDLNNKDSLLTSTVKGNISLDASSISNAYETLLDVKGDVSLSNKSAIYNVSARNDIAGNLTLDDSQFNLTSSKVTVDGEILFKKGSSLEMKDSVATFGGGMFTLIFQKQS